MIVELFMIELGAACSAHCSHGRNQLGSQNPDLDDVSHDFLVRYITLQGNAAMSGERLLTSLAQS
jgi:hypothetical protein